MTVAGIGAWAIRAGTRDHVHQVRIQPGLGLGVDDRVGGLAQAARRAPPGQHLAAGVVQHHQRAVFDVAPVQLAQVLGVVCTAKRCSGALRVEAARGQPGLRLLRQQAAGKVRRHALAGGPGGAATRPQ